MALLLFAAFFLVACATEDDEGGGGGGGGGGSAAAATVAALCGAQSVDNMNFNYRGTAQLFIAPDGVDNGNDCRDRNAPCKTFAQAMDELQPGEGLILLDGTYTLADNGSLQRRDSFGNETSPHSARIKSGRGIQRPTVIAAENPGQAELEGSIRLGENDEKVQFVLVHGITFHQGGSIRNANYTAMKNVGFEFGLGFGTIDHSEGVSCNLVEDAWVWGKNRRATVTVYRANANILRRVLIRDDGCDEEWCGDGKFGNYSAGITVYNSNNNVLENVIVMDRIHGGNVSPEGQHRGYGDFTTAQHDSFRPPQPGGETLHNNHWLGNMSINSEDRALYFNADNIGPGTTGFIKDFVALNTDGGVTLDGNRRSYTGISVFEVDGLKVFPNRGDFRVGCDVVNPDEDPATGAPPDCGVHIIGTVDEGPYVPGIAASVLPQKRYGTEVDLWPWPNEALIKSQICTVEGQPVSHGVCGTGLSITDYLFSL